MKLRKYQEEAVFSFCQGCKKFDRQLIVLPTGAGKTITFAFLALRFWAKRRERTLILVHREQLMKQAVDKIISATGLVPSVEMGTNKGSLDSEVVVASVQSLRGERLTRYPSNHFGLVVADEAHHVLSSSWLKVLDYFQGKKLGVTATPGRGDKRELGEFFQNIAHEVTLPSLISEGYLCPILVQTIPLKIDLEKVQVARGDLVGSDLETALMPVLQEVSTILKNVIGTRKTLVFLPLIRTSKLFARLCCEQGLTAEHVDGESESSQKLEDFRLGKFQVLTNAMLLTEGYDEPSIECVVNLRPTKSKELYCQIIGRGTRLSPGKQNLLVMDFLWLFKRHMLARPSSIIATDEKIEELMTKKSENGEPIDLVKLHENSLHEREQALIQALKAKRRRKEKLLNFSEIFDSYSALQKVDSASPCPPSETQKSFLMKHKIDPSTVFTGDEADLAIMTVLHRKENNLCTIPQAAFLKRLGHPNPWSASFQAAETFISKRLSK